MAESLSGQRRLSHPAQGPQNAIHTAITIAA